LAATFSGRAGAQGAVWAVVGGVLLAVVIVVAILTGGCGRDSWPTAFEGTWVSSNNEKWVVSSAQGRAVLKRVRGDGHVLVAYTFAHEGDTLAMAPDAVGGAPSSFTRQPGSTGAFVGDYALNGGHAGDLRIAASYEGRTLTVLWSAAVFGDFQQTLTLADDGESLVYANFVTEFDKTYTKQ